jgi:hypothetical protein
MPSVPVSGHVRRASLSEIIETNIRLVSAPDGVLSVQRIRLESNDGCVDLQQKVCSRLRDDGIPGVPSPWDPREIVVPFGTVDVRGQAQGEGWHSRLVVTEFGGKLDLKKERELAAAGELVQRAIVCHVEQSGRFWWLSESSRLWYSDEPVAAEEGVILLPRLSISTSALGENRLGIAFDGGHMVCTENTVAEFLKTRQSRESFEAFRHREEGRRGTLIYDTAQARRSKCYFHDFADGMMCDSTGVIVVHGRQYRSLLDYYQRNNPKLPVSGTDKVVSVSFEWGDRPVLVAAKLLRLRLRLDPATLPRGLRRLSMSPSSRRTFSQTHWTTPTRDAVKRLGVVTAPSLWQPSAKETIQIAPPALLFGNGQKLSPPQTASLPEYRRYYHEREQFLRDHGVYRFNPAASREVVVVVPRPGGNWSQELQDAFVDGVRTDLEQIAKQNFRITVETADSARDIPRLLQKRLPGTCLIVFDDRELDGAAYYLLSKELRDWTMKRVTRWELARKFGHLRSARDHQERINAERSWRDTLFHTVIDLLDQMGAILYRVEDWDYEACLAIDVSEDRRFCALSFLICRNAALYPGREGLWRYLECWTKPDTRRETIEMVQLADKIAKIPGGLHGLRIAPLKSLLVLRDGHECGDEAKAIDEALDHWKKLDVLAQAASVDVIDYHKRTVKELRMWRLANEEADNVLEGRSVFLDQQVSLLCPTGAATVGKHATADPILLIGREQSDIRRATSGVFALAQHNWLSPKKAYRDAQPVRDADHELTRRMAMEVRLR